MAGSWTAGPNRCRSTELRNDEVETEEHEPGREAEQHVSRRLGGRAGLAVMNAAVRGLSAPVAIGPAMAFALSWKPVARRT